MDEISRFLLTIDCEGERYSEINRCSMEQSVCNVERALDFARNHQVRVALMATPGFLTFAGEARIQRWLRSGVEPGLHIHPDDLPCEITAKLDFLRQVNTLLASYSGTEQQQILQACNRFCESLGWNPTGFRGGYYSMNDNTSRSLITVSGIKWQSHLMCRSEYSVRSRILKARPILANPACPGHAFGVSASCASLCFEDHGLDLLQETTRRYARQYDEIVAITHSIYLGNETFQKMSLYVQWLNGGMS